MLGTSPSTQSSQGSDATRIPPDAIDLSELPADAKRVPPIESTFDSMNIEPVKLERPLLMVHGLAQHADTWATFKTHLCSDSDNKWGGVFHVDKEEEFNKEKDPDAKVFALDVSDNLGAPRVVANEVRRAITAIMEKTGTESVDVMTHSMGSLVTREAIRQGEDAIANLLMISPPNRGAYEATAATFLGDSRVYQHYPAAKFGAMDALRLEYGPRGGVTNEWLHGLNTFWENDKERPRAAIITGIGVPTPDLSKTATSPGDGMVAARRAPLPGAEFHLAVPNKLPAGDPNFRDFQDFRYNHLQVVSEPEIWQAAGKFLEGGKDKNKPSQSFGEAVEDAKKQSAELRQKVDRAESARESHHNKQKLATKLGVAGAALTAMGLAANSVPIVGPALLIGGSLAFATGGVYGLRAASNLGGDSRVAVNSAEASLNLADNLLHRYQRHGDAGLEEYPSKESMSETMDKTRATRSALGEADFDRRYSQRTQSRGMTIASIGAALGGISLAAQMVAPSTLGKIGLIAGGVGLAGGGLTAWVQSPKLGQTAELSSEMATQSLDLADEVIESFQK